ncbi:hypothetical protein TNCV_4272591 [Trichonephila clavipes]|nr:hypothetical protein TNCV_4272591 [Trichonephila clavipes]
MSRSRVPGVAEEPPCRGGGGTLNPLALLFPSPLEQESMHEVHLTFLHNSVPHQVLIFKQLSQGNAPSVQMMSRRSMEIAGTLCTKIGIVSKARHNPTSCPDEPWNSCT